jgi:hypothetical protein
LDKIYRLWDKILAGPPSLPLFIGISILQQLRQELLISGYNEAIGIFSESLPEIDIEKCIDLALSFCKVTPPSAYWLTYDVESRETLNPSSPIISWQNRTTAAITTTINSAIADKDKESLAFNNNEILSPVRQWWESPISLHILEAELAPRIHWKDLIRLKHLATVIDIRPENEYKTKKKKKKKRKEFGYGDK